MTRSAFARFASVDALDDERAVAVEVADDRIDLGESETHRVSDYQS